MDIPTFADSEGVRWSIDISVDDMKRVQRELSINLAMGVLEKDASGQSPLLVQLATDVILLVDVLYVLCKPRCDELGLSSEAFGRRMKPDNLGSLYGAFFGALVRFFQGLNRASAVATIQKTIEALAAGDEMIATEVRKVDVSALISGALSTNGQGFAVSSPGRIAHEN